MNRAQTLDCGVSFDSYAGPDLPIGLRASFDRKQLKE